VPRRDYEHERDRFSNDYEHEHEHEHEHDDYTTFSICSRWRLNAKPGSRVSCVGTSRPPDPGGRLVDKLRPEPGVMNVGWARLTGSPPARSSPRFIAKFVESC
jgi:hypothetical protein